MILKKILSWLLTHVRIRVPKVPGVTLDFLIFQTDRYYRWYLGIEATNRVINIYLVFLTIQITKYHIRYVQKREVFIHTPPGEQINIAACSDYLFDVVFEEAIKLETNVKRKLKIKDNEKVGFSLSASYSPEDKFLYVEPFIYVEFDKIKIPKAFLAKQEIRNRNKKIEFDRMPIHQRITYKDFWEK